MELRQNGGEEEALQRQFESFKLLFSKRWRVGLSLDRILTQLTELRELAGLTAEARHALELVV